MSAAITEVCVRLYGKGLGDLCLVEIVPPASGSFWILFDGGAADTTARTAAVLADIARLTTRLDVAVVTAANWHAVAALAATGSAGFEIGELWCAWTGNPADPQAQGLDRFRNDAVTALDGAAERLRPAAAANPTAAALAHGLAAILGDPSGDPRSTAIVAGDRPVRYLEPGAVVPLPAGLGVTAYVLGPSRAPGGLGVRDGIGSYGIAASLNASFALADGSIGVDDDPGAPFDETEGLVLSALPATGRHAAFVRDYYTGLAEVMPVPLQDDPDRPQADQAWRRIDGDWLGASAALALQLDACTVDSRPALALDLGRPQPVLVFAVGTAADWASVAFADGTKATDLLARASCDLVGGDVPLPPDGVRSALSVDYRF